MGKKVSLLSYLYLIGMALVAIGFCCPMFNGLFGSSANGFDFIKNAKDGGFVAIGAILIIAGAVVLVIGFMTSGGIYKAIGKQLLKRATIGFYLIVVGIVAAIVGALKK